ncbi:hypothetical protein WMO40_21060 [Bacillaceae bacterium CLA-AA-H227]|uniref:Uncharacterized protein n=1 Tax=Robertmurraya yapensis (ex Hitch et al 2024) TaxID=3133160 RepID=A0ACC6SGF9_9BACI
MDAQLSPFSLRHEWTIKWQENDRVHENAMNWNGKIEDELLPALASVGVISSLQLKNLFFNGDNRKISKLCSTGKLIRHTLIRNKMEIPIFTLGPTSVEMMKDRMSITDWRDFTISDILQRLIFFQLMTKFKRDDQKVSIIPSVKPFVAAFIRNNKKFHVLIERGNTQEIIHTLKFYSPRERFIFIKENVNHGQELNEFLINCKVRMTTDNDLDKPFDEMFYIYTNGEWLLEKNTEDRITTIETSNAER